MQTISTEATLLEQGVDMMLYGMGSVFVFLFALVLAISLMSSLIAKFFPEPQSAEPVVEAGNQLLAPVDTLTLRIIQTAIDLHRKRPEP